MVSSWQLNWWIAEVHRHLGQTRKLAEIGNSNRPVPFSGSLWERKTRVSARSESFRGKNVDRRDSLAERGEFELPVPICEQSDDSTRFNVFAAIAAIFRSQDELVLGVVEIAL